MTDSQSVVLIASESYEGDESDDFLTFKEGDIFVDCKIVDKNWFQGQLKTSGKCGKIPKTHVISLNGDELIDKDENKKSLNLTENPFCDDETPSPSFSPMCNYVDMSSDESINHAEENSPMISDEGRKEKNKGQLEKVAKLPDEGYNSSSHYSSETQDSDKPPPVFQARTTDESRQDEAGYEVPTICFKELSNQKMQRKDKRRKSLKSLLKVKTVNSSGIESDVDEARNQFYNPPVDHTEVNFSHYKSFLRLRMVLSAVAALAVFLLLFFILFMVVKIHPLLSFSLAAVLFLLTLIIPATLKRKQICCFSLVLLPSLTSAKSKTALFLLIVLLVLLGPIFGIILKLEITLLCSQEGKANNSIDTLPLKTRSLSATIDNEFNEDIAKKNQPVKYFCDISFGKVREYCLGAHERLLIYCGRKKPYLSDIEVAICQKNESVFCFSNETLFHDLCNAKPTQAKQKQEILNNRIMLRDFAKDLNDKKSDKLESVRIYLLYLTPLLILFLFWDAYNYNVLYLTTKANDNIYITRRIKEIDVERENRGLTDVIIPLTRIEFQYYLLRSSISLSRAECLSFFKWLLSWILCLCISQLIILLEDNIDEVLLSSQPDVCSWYYRTTREQSYRFVLHLLIGLLFLLILSQSHVLRLRSLICDYFYPDLIDTRSKYLYYKILHDRNTFSKQLKRKVHLLSEQKRLLSRISYLNVLKKVLPLSIQKALSKVRFAKCMVCDSFTQRIIECKNVSCQADFCYACFVDSGQICLICKSSSKDV